ncbi:MAG: ABC transporter permease [Marmoricola sp.]
MTTTPEDAAPSDTSPEQSQTLAAADFADDRSSMSLAESARAYKDRVRGGDMGALPAVLGLVVLFAVFSSLRPETFTSNLNIANLLVQASAISILAMGLVPVLLLGEIDLSAGVTGGVAAGYTAVAIARNGQGWFLAVLIGLAVGALIGMVIGTLVAKLGIPSFVVTLAFFLGLQGVTLKLIGLGGTIPVRDEVLRAITIKSMPVATGWIVVIVILALYAGLLFWRQSRLAAKGLHRPPTALLVVKVVALSAILLGMTALLSQNRSRVPTFDISGIPYAVFLVGALLIFWTFIFGRTSYGRHIYAIGGNTEAARRAGISVDRLKISVFVIGSGMAAMSGIVSASYTGNVSPGSGAGNTLLYAVGAAVIGGTSLFGGKGKIQDAVIGGLVIATIDNGLGLLNQAAYINYIITGSVLLLAASVDAISRRRRSATGT